MTERLKGRNAVVTGASQGIGKSVALELAKEGANIVLVGHTTPLDNVTADCGELGIGAVPYQGDVADFNICEDIIKTCVNEFGTIDILCNIAGIFNPKMILDVSEDEWDRMIAVHLKGTFNLARHATPLMKEQSYGRIVNFISQVWVGAGADAPYSAAKGGIATLTYSTAWDMASFGVTCNAISPTAGTKDVEAMRAYMWPKVEQGLWPQDLFDRYMKELMAPVEYISSVVAYLCSEESGYITGRIFSASASKLSYWSPPKEINTFLRDWETQGGWTWGDVGKYMPELIKGEAVPWE